MTTIAFISRRDFSFLGGVLRWGGFCALGLIVAGVIFGFHRGMLFSIEMVAFAESAVLYDTSKMIHHHTRDRYVGAVLELFASVPLMFWYVIRILLGGDD